MLEETQAIGGLFIILHLELEILNHHNALQEKNCKKDPAECLWPLGTINGVLRVKINYYRAQGSISNQMDVTQL